MPSPAVLWHKEMRPLWLAQGLEFSRYGRRQGLPCIMEKNLYHWGRVRVQVKKSMGNRGGEAGKRNLMWRRRRLL